MTHHFTAISCVLALSGGTALADHLTDFAGTLSGLNQVPDPVFTDASGTISGTYDSILNEFSFNWVITGDLEGDPASPGAHLHMGSSGTNGPIVFGFNNPDGTWELSGSAVWSGLSGDEVDALFAGDIYANFHTTAYAGGEIRGQFMTVPAPSSLGLLAMVGFGGMARRRR